MLPGMWPPRSTTTHELNLYPKLTQQGDDGESECAGPQTSKCVMQVSQKDWVMTNSAQCLEARLCTVTNFQLQRLISIQLLRLIYTVDITAINRCDRKHQRVLSRCRFKIIPVSIHVVGLQHLHLHPLSSHSKTGGVLLNGQQLEQHPQFDDNSIQMTGPWL